jgi:ketosteroid isomerase-like protein
MANDWRWRTALLLGLAVASAAGARPGPDAPAPDLEAERAALLRTDAEFSDAAQRMPIGEAFARYADANATMLPAGAEPVTGLDAIRGQFADAPPGTSLAWKPFAAEVSRCADLGYTLGRYEYRAPGPDGKTAVRHGKYCSVWKKQRDGSWKWIVDVGNASPEPKR